MNPVQFYLDHARILDLTSDYIMAEGIPDYTWTTEVIHMGQSRSSRSPSRGCWKNSSSSSLRTVRRWSSSEELVKDIEKDRKNG